MNKISIKFLNNNIEFSIDKYKFFLGKNYRFKHNLIRSLLRYFSKKVLSEYFENYNYKNFLRIDEKRIDTRGWKLFKIDSYFNLDDDLKMGTRSLMKNYFEVILQDIEYDGKH